jgi:N6-L-threonylcarbamoyladenine synthase
MVHHLEAHCLSARLDSAHLGDQSVQKFPFLALLASGGHTSLVLCHGVGVYDILGGTVDDALGKSTEKINIIILFITLKERHLIKLQDF